MAFSFSRILSGAKDLGVHGSIVRRLGDGLIDIVRIVGNEPLSIRLLGQFLVRRGEEAPLSLESGRAESLLGYVLLNRDAPQPRQRVAFALWPDSREAQALTNLRHVLHNLRRSLPALGDYLNVTARSLQWRPDAVCELDVAVFEDALARDSLAEAVEAYTGDLMAGREEEWLEQERRRLRRRFLDALDRLANRLEMHGDLAAAVRYGERLLREEPLREETYRLLMRLHDAGGDRARAVRVYHDCAATLERELGIEPAAATRTAYEALLARDESGDEGRRLGGTPLIGRSRERALLVEAWRAAPSGARQLLLIGGEAGVGKTRLAEDFRTWAGHRGAITATARAYAGEGALAFGPMVSWLRSAGLRPRVRGMDRRSLRELSRLLPELSIERPGVSGSEWFTLSDQRQRLYEAVARTLLAAPAPLLLVADDLQWWDRETLQLLHYLLRLDSGSPLLVVATARREDVDLSSPLTDLLAALRVAERLTEVELGRLGRTETSQLAQSLTRAPLGPRDADELYAQTEGNPLFVVEAVRSGWQPGGDVLTPRVQAVIAARLAQLSPGAREVLDVVATVGREFTGDIVVAVGGRSEDDVVRALDELWRRRIIRELDAVAYDFSHDKIREAAYLALSPVRRRHLHRQVAHALEQVHAHDPAAVSGQLAKHYEQAGELERAVMWCARAADVAQQRYAHGEAVRLLTRALSLARTLPAGSRDSGRELELLTALLAPLVAGEGYASPRIHEVHQQALSLSGSLGAAPAAPLLRSLGLGSLARGDFAAAAQFGVALRHRGDQENDRVLQVEGEYLLGVTAFWAAELVQARAHFEAASGLYRDELRGEHLLRYGQDPKTICLTRLACTLWLLGEPEAAVRARDAGLDLARRIGHPYSHATSLLFASLLAVDMQDQTALRGYVAELSARVTADLGTQTSGVAACLEAYVAVLDGRAAEVARIQRILGDQDPAHQVAPGIRSAMARILLAACDAAGDAPSGLAAADELLAMTSSRVWQPEAARQRARFLALLGPGNA